ncbi:MAG: helix-turn-helix domain-containing protein [Hyphomonadaceae bacterium]|nr:helix-turn-helix domain-containing protein [Hyphomonadaceae bacterium]
MRAGGAKARIYGAAMRLFAESGANAVTVSDLADAAGIARGTIYNNVGQPENLFGEIASALAHEMIWRTEASMGDLRDPVARIATGVRLFVRRAHEDQDWGRFLVRFALAHTALQNLMTEPPARDIQQAISRGKFTAELSAVPALITMLNGATLAAMNAVIHGEQTWRSAGSLTAEFFLRAGGVARTNARKISRTELPPLAQKPLKKLSQPENRIPARERH